MVRSKETGFKVGGRGLQKPGTHREVSSLWERQQGGLEDNPVSL